MKKIKVLFLCNENNARSQIAEAILNEYAGDRFEAQSAGIVAGTLDPIAIQSMQDIGIDMTNKRTKTINELQEKGEVFNYIITVCSDDTHKKCPSFSDDVKKIHWEYVESDDHHTHREKRNKFTIDFRDSIIKKVRSFEKEIFPENSNAQNNI